MGIFGSFSLLMGASPYVGRLVEGLGVTGTHSPLLFFGDVPPPIGAPMALLLFALAVVVLATLLLRKRKDTPAHKPVERHTLPHGREIFHYNKAETDIIYKELWDKDAYLPADLPLRVKPGDIVIDAGANVGLFSMYIWERCQGDVTLYAFEPVPSIYRVLEANAAEVSKVGPGMIHAFPVGLSQRREQASFLHHPKMSIWSTAHSDFDQKRAAQLDRDLPDIVDFLVSREAPRWVRWLPRGMVKWGARMIAKAANETEAVTCILEPLSAIIDHHQIDRIDLLKIDVEGNELPLLLGIRDEHWPLIAQLTMEVEDLATLAHIEALLTTRGFAHASGLAEEIHAIGVASELSYLRAWRPEQTDVSQAQKC